MLHGQLWMDQPVTVVGDRGDEFAVLLEPGSRFRFVDHPQRVHPWAGQAAWRGPQVLQIYRLGLWYSVWMFFDAGRFRNWYINFEAPVSGRSCALIGTYCRDGPASERPVSDGLRCNVGS